MKWFEGRCFVFDFEFEYVLNWVKTFSYLLCMFGSLSIPFWLMWERAKRLFFLGYALL